MLVQSFIDELARRLRDVNKRQWQEPLLLNALNASMRALCSVMPSSSTVHRTLTLVEGTEQRLPADVHKILQILHNVCPESGEPRRAITLADKAVMDTVYPHWRQDAPRNYIRHYMQDALNESTFYVWPPAVAFQPGNRVRGVFTTTPSFIESVVNRQRPVEPVEPVNPGPIGFGSNRADYYADNVIVDSNNFNWITVVSPTDPPLPFDSSGTYQLHADNGDTFDLVWPATAQLGSADVTFEGFVKSPTSTSNARQFLRFRDLGGSANLKHNDPRLVEGALIRVQQAGSSFLGLIAVDEYAQGTTQEEVVAYRVAKALYDIEKAAYDTAVNNDSKPAATIPFNDIYLEPLFEYALYYCYAVDDETIPNTARANRHWQAFFQLLNKHEDTMVQVLANREEVE